MRILCLNCGRPYPESGAPYCCPKCGGLYDNAEPFTFQEMDGSAQGIWRHVASLGFDLPPVSLGEGQTPLICADAFFERKVGSKAKCKYSAQHEESGTDTHNPRNRLAGPWRLEGIAIHGI